MDHFLSAHGGPLISGAVAIALLILGLKMANAILRLVGMVVLIALLLGGYVVYGGVMAIQKAAAAATHQGRLQGRLTSAAALAKAVGPPARQALASAGLKPAFLRIYVVCAGPHTSVQLRYVDRSFLFGVVSHQTVDVPLGDSARC
jgi:hypothetical protein